MMLSLPASLQLDEILVRQVVGDVGVAALQQRAPVAGGRHHAPDDALDLRQRTAVPVVVALEDDFGAGGPAHDRRRRCRRCSAWCIPCPTGLFRWRSSSPARNCRSPARSPRDRGSSAGPCAGSRRGRCCRRRRRTARAWSSEPAPIWKVGKPPTVTARSSDHFTSLAVTGVPSWNVAFFFSLKVADMSPTFMSSASSILNLSRS